MNSFGSFCVDLSCRLKPKQCFLLSSLTPSGIHYIYYFCCSSEVYTHFHQLLSNLARNASPSFLKPLGDVIFFVHVGNPGRGRPEHLFELESDFGVIQTNMGLKLCFFYAIGTLALIFFVRHCFYMPALGWKVAFFIPPNIV